MTNKELTVHIYISLPFFFPFKTPPAYVIHKLKKKKEKEERNLKHQIGKVGLQGTFEHWENRRAILQNTKL